MAPNENFRIAPLTPPGSATSVANGINLTNTPVAAGCTQGLRLVVDDIDQAKDEPSSRGVDVTAVDDRPGVGSPGTATRTATGGSSTKHLAAELVRPAFEHGAGISLRSLGTEDGEGQHRLLPTPRA